MMQHLPVVPHITLYLDVSPSTCLYRINNVRGRECESSIPLQYLQGLDTHYKTLLNQLQEMGSEIVTIPWNEFGTAEFVKQNLDAAILLKLQQQKQQHQQQLQQLPQPISPSKYSTHSQQQQQVQQYSNVVKLFSQETVHFVNNEKLVRDAMTIKTPIVAATQSPQKHQQQKLHQLVQTILKELGGEDVDEHTMAYNISEQCLFVESVIVRRNNSSTSSTVSTPTVAVLQY